MADRTWAVLATVVVGLCGWFLVADLPTFGYAPRTPPSQAGKRPSARPPGKLALKLPGTRKEPSEDAMTRPDGGADTEPDATGGAPTPEVIPTTRPQTFPEVPEEAHSIWPATAQGIRSAVEELEPQLRECYLGWKLEAPDLEGEVIVVLTVSPNDTDPGLGTVTEATLEDTSLDHEWMEACVLSVMSGIELEDPPADGLMISYPLRFSNGP